MGQKMHGKLIHIKQPLPGLNRGLNNHVDLERGYWQQPGNYSQRSSEASFVSAKFHSFEEDQRDMFYDRMSQEGSMVGKPLSGLAGILKAKDVS